MAKKGVKKVNLTKAPGLTREEIIEKALKINRLETIDNYAFLAYNMKEIIISVGLKQVAVAEKLKVEKTKLQRRFENPDLWGIEELRKVIAMIEDQLKN
jgi:hypothetical protein